VIQSAKEVYHTSAHYGRLFSLPISALRCTAALLAAIPAATYTRDSTMRALIRTATAFLLLLVLACTALSQSEKSASKKTWKPVPFAIVKFNEEAPKSWNLYSGGKRGVLLVRVWKRYLLVDTNEEQAFDIDPQEISVQGENVQWSQANLPDTPLDTAEWKGRNVGPVYRVRFRLSKEGHFLELQIPLRPDGKPAY
jgi:hypothetical protein